MTTFEAVPPTQKVALITGCSDPDSLGAAFALDLIKRGGWRVYASSIDAKSMGELRRAGCERLELDVTNPEHIKAVSATIGDKLDLLINNAAVEGLGPLLDADPNMMMEMYEVNTVAPLVLVQTFAEGLIRSTGCIVNIGSVGVYGLPFHGVYASSKAAMQTLSDVMRREMAHLGVRVTTVELGMVLTSMLKAEAPFPINYSDGSTGRSPHFTKWYNDLLPAYRADIDKRTPSAMSSGQAARQIIDSVEKQGKRGAKIWIGTMAWVFRWIWPLLSTAKGDKINADIVHLDLL